MLIAVFTRRHNEKIYVIQFTCSHDELFVRPYVLLFSSYIESTIGQAGKSVV